MRILVLDDFLKKRDPAMMDMYSLMAKKHTLLFDCMTALVRGDYDLLWLGIYHRSMEIDFSQVFAINTKPIIIDQADNEETAERMELYRGLKNVTLLSRYLPNKPMEVKSALFNFTLKLLPWYVNPQRVPTNNKSCDIAFICSLYGEREKIADTIRYISRKMGYSTTIGEYWGSEYLERLSKCRVSVVECNRFCLTQKYIEGALANCVLVGDKPLFPKNNMDVIDTLLLDAYELRDALRTAMGRKNTNLTYVLDTFANEGWFYNHLNHVI